MPARGPAANGARRLSRMTAGYSGTPLPRKLGIKPGHRLALVAAPDGFLGGTLGPLPEGVEIAAGLDGHVDVAVVFVTAVAELTETLPALAAATAPDGAIWVAWPKRASRVPTDMSEDRVRDVALPTGLVDTKVCAIDATWSGLRLSLRRELRRKR